MDLVREGVDCVLRAGTLQDSLTVDRCVVDLEQIACASPAYLMQLGVPANLKALARHRQLSVRVACLPTGFRRFSLRRTRSGCGPAPSLRAVAWS